MSEIIAEKFCSLAKVEGEERDECLSILKEITGEVGLIANVGEEKLNQLSQVTHKSFDEILEIMMLSCPLCPQ